MSAVPCHVCGADALQPVPGLEDLRGVTSDCRPWPRAGALHACGACGCVQKAVDDAWRRQMDELYAGYAIYHQGGGAEQAVFADGQAHSRSQRLLACLGEHVTLPATGRLLDVGCGNGALLRAFPGLRPGWRLAGTERGREHWEQMATIPGIEDLYTSAPAGVPGRFDLVTMVHVLEHLDGPRRWLAQVHAKLEAGGRLVVEVPDYRQNPFDLLIADHCSHFTEVTAGALVGAAGFDVEAATTDWVPKELSLVARRTDAATVAPRVDDAAAAADHAGTSLAWLRATLDAARAAATSAATGGQLGLFGTSIAATWLAGELGQAVSFFVDEDPNRAGSRYLDRPIHHPRDAPADGEVFLALAPRLAPVVGARLRAEGHPFRCVEPPPMPATAP